MKTCIAVICDKPATRTGLCNAHYMKEYRRQQKLKPTYEDGITEGVQIAVEAVHDLLASYGGRCDFWGTTLAITIQSKRLTTELEL